MPKTVRKAESGTVLPLRPQAAPLLLTEATAAVAVCVLAVQANLDETGDKAIPDFCVGFDFELVDDDGDGKLNAKVAIDPAKLKA